MLRAAVLVTACVVLEHAGAACPTTFTTKEYFVDPAAGSDAAAGNKGAPFKTIAHGVKAAEAARTSATNVIVNLLAGTHDVSATSVRIEGGGSPKNTCADVWAGGTFTLKGAAGNRLVGGKPFT